MTIYSIDYTDPLKRGFSIAPSTFNGPGNTQQETPLRLYGRSSLNWGEAVNENMVRMLESFAGATPPFNPLGGQLWNRQYLYWQNADIALPSVGPTGSASASSGAFYVYDFLTGNWLTGASFPVTVVNRSSGVPDIPGFAGQHVFNTFNQQLYIWESPYKQGTPQWMHRARTIASTSTPVDGLVIPSNGVTKPISELTVYDAETGEWRIIAVYENGNLELGSQTYRLPSSNNAATIKYVNEGLDTILAEAAGLLTESVLGPILDGRYVNVTGDTMTGFLTLHSNPTSNLHAATKQYADGISSTLTTAINGKVAKAGDTMTGFLTLNADPTNIMHAATKQYVDSINSTLTTAINGKVAKAGDTMTGFLTLHSNPTNNMHAATKQYVDSAISAGGGYTGGSGFPIARIVKTGGITVESFVIEMNIKTGAFAFKIATTASDGAALGGAYLNGYTTTHHVSGMSDAALGDFLDTWVLPVTSGTKFWYWPTMIQAPSLSNGWVARWSVYSPSTAGKTSEAEWVIFASTGKAPTFELVGNRAGPANNHLSFGFKGLGWDRSFSFNGVVNVAFVTGDVGSTVGVASYSGDVAYVRETRGDTERSPTYQLESNGRYLQILDLATV